jgi:formylglycine-generating enzyme required for sulfatase activity
MRKLFILVLTIIMVIVSACSQKESENFVLVKGGNFINTRSNYYGTSIKISDFYVSKYEVTQKEWTEVMGSNPSQFKGNNLPVETVSWYDCLEYCNKRGIKEGLRPYYKIDRNKQDPDNTNHFDSIKWTVTVDAKGNGYRLLTEAEWEYTAGGGQMSKSYKYSGSNDVDKVGWFWKNSGDSILTGYWSWPSIEKNHCKTKPVGSKGPNELGLYDMSGNVREWCWDWFESNVPDEPKGRIWKGGGWIGADFCCEPSFRAGHHANGKGPDQGFRVCRSK